MKKLSALLLILVLVLSLAACGKKEEENKTTGTPEPTKEATTPEPTKEVTEAPTAEPTEEVTPEPTEEVTPEPTEEVTPEPTEEVTPEPTEEVTPEPTEEVTPEPTETPEPTDTPAEDDIFTKSEGVMTYQEYVAAEVDAEVVVETFVQDKQSWWEDKATIYTQDNEGAYFVYEMACSQEDYEKLVPGQKIKITGFKGEWQGEVEIVDGTFELLEGNYVADPVDVTEYLGTENMINFQNQYVLFKGLTVAASQDADGNEAAFLYKWNGSGSEGDDLYFNVEYNGQTFTFTVESYLRGKETDVYQAVKSLNVGDKIDLIGYAYWYDTLNPHIIEIAAAEE